MIIKPESIRKTSLYLVPLLTVFFLARSAVPYFIYPFIGLFIFYTLFFFFFEYKKILILNYIRKFRLYLLVLFIYLFAVLFTDSISFNLIKEVLNAIAISLVGFYWFILIEKYGNWSNLKITFINQFLVIIFFAAIAGLIKYFLQLIGIKLSFLEYDRWFQTTSLVKDHNIFSLNLLIGIGFALSYVKKRLNLFYRTGLQISILLLSLAILLSGSRRGFIILVFGYILLIINLLFVFFRNKPAAKNIFRNTYILFISFYSILTLLIVFVFFTSSQFKNRLFEENDTEFLSFRYGLNLTISDYVSIFNSDLSYEDIDELLWGNNEYLNNFSNTNFSLFPELYNVATPKKIVFPLLFSSEIPMLAGGIIFDPLNANSIWYNQKSNKYLIYGKYILPKFRYTSGKIYKVSVWCYVSDSASFDIARLEYPKSTLNGVFRSYYNMQKKGIWQKLEVKFSTDKDSSINFSFMAGKYSLNNFNNIEGYILFAYPEIKEYSFDQYGNKKIYSRENISRKTKIYDTLKINSQFDHSNNVTLSLASVDNQKKTSSFISRLFDKIQNNYEIKRSDNYYDTEDYLLAAKGYRKVLISNPTNRYAWDKLQLCIKKEIFFDQSYLEWEKMDSIYSYKRLNNDIENPNNSINDKQLGNIIQQKYLHEDSINKTRNIEGDINMGDFNLLYGQRTERWKYAYQIFRNEYNLFQKLIGNGFNYQKKFGKRFGTKDQLDYPHNIVISSVLYSGIVGGIIYLFYILYIFKWYWKNKNEELLFGVITLLAFLYSMVSSNSHFDSTILAFFALIPFLLSKNNN